jgi:malic enzyme
VSDEMIFASAQAVASQATDTAPGASLLPSNADLRITSSTVSVARTAIAQGLARASIEDLVGGRHTALSKRCRASKPAVDVSCAAIRDVDGNYNVSHPTISHPA